MTRCALIVLRSLSLCGPFVALARLVIGFITFLQSTASGVTSTDGAVRRMGRWWKRLHRVAYPLAVLALLHHFIQSKATVSEPTFSAELYVWLMLRRALPMAWPQPASIPRQSRGF
jgi:DMSO/TMAO reductase YedYZ heme-binding membrane subunit